LVATMIGMINSRVELEKDDYCDRVELPRRRPVAWVVIASRNPRNKTFPISAQPKRCENMDLAIYGLIHNVRFFCLGGHCCR